MVRVRVPPPALRPEEVAVQHLWPLLDAWTGHDAAVLSDALEGDGYAQVALWDLIEERGDTVHPFQAGRAYLLETMTLYYVGLVVEATPCWLKLEKASWVHWTGRKGTLMASKSFAKAHFRGGGSTPRTEYVGSMVLAVGAVNAAFEWPEKELPAESIQ